MHLGFSHRIIGGACCINETRNNEEETRNVSNRGSLPRMPHRNCARLSTYRGLRNGRGLGTGVRKKNGFQLISFDYPTGLGVSTRVTLG